MDQQRPTRRMNDMGPRRGMDGFPRPSNEQEGHRGGMASPSRASRSQPQPQRPMQPSRPMRAQQPVREQQPMRQPYPAQRPIREQSRRAAQADDRYFDDDRRGRDEGDYDDRRAPRRGRSRKEAPERRSGGTWRTVLQFVIGLLIIAGVAFAIVALYIRYYQ